MEDIKLITLNEIEYQIRKVNAIKQFHFARKLAGCFSGLINSKDKDEQVNIFISNISSMPDKQAEDILFLLLQGVYRKEPKGLGWSPVIGKSGLMYDDLDLFTLGILAVESIKINLNSFMQHMPQYQNMFQAVQAMANQ